MSLFEKQILFVPSLRAKHHLLKWLSDAWRVRGDAMPYSPNGQASATAVRGGAILSPLYRSYSDPPKYLHAVFGVSASHSSLSVSSKEEFLFCFDLIQTNGGIHSAF